MSKFARKTIRNPKFVVSHENASTQAMVNVAREKDGGNNNVTSSGNPSALSSTTETSSKTTKLHNRRKQNKPRKSI